MAREDQNSLAGYQVAQNQLLQIQQEQQQNLIAAQQASRSNNEVNQVARQAVGLLTANQQAAINANVNPQTRGILQKYGVGKPQTIQSQQRVGQNVIINNNTTNNNYGGPVQGRELNFRSNNIAMKQQVEESNRFKAWLSSLFNKQQADSDRRDKEFMKRTRSLEKQSEQVTKRLGNMGKGIVEGLSPKRVIGSMNSGLKRLLMIFGLHLLAKNWDKILNKVADIENTVKGWIDYFGISADGAKKKASSFIQDIRNLFMGKDAAKSGKSFIDYLKDIFIGDDKKSIWGYIKLYFEHKKNERVDALSRLKFPKLDMTDLDNIPGAIMKIMSFLGDVISVSINGAAGIKKAVQGNINRTALNRTYEYNKYKKHLYNSRTVGKYGVSGKYSIKNELGKTISIDENDVGAGDLAVLKGDFKGQYKGNFNRITHELLTDKGTATSAKLGQAAELSSLLTLARAGKINSAGVIRSFNQLYKHTDANKFDTPLPDYLLDHLVNKDSFLRNTKNIKKTKFKLIWQPREGFEQLEESVLGSYVNGKISSKVKDELGLNSWWGNFAKFGGYLSDTGHNVADAFRTNDMGVKDPLLEAGGNLLNAVARVPNFAVRTVTLGNYGFDNTTLSPIANALSKGMDGVEDYVAKLVPMDYQAKSDEVDSGETFDVYAANKEGIKELGRTLLGTSANNNFDMSKISSREIQNGLLQIAKRYGNTDPDLDMDINSTYADVDELESLVAENDAERAKLWKQTYGSETADRVSESISNGISNAKSGFTNIFTGAKDSISNAIDNLSSASSATNSTPSTTPSIPTVPVSTVTANTDSAVNNTKPASPPKTITINNSGVDILNLSAAMEYCQRPKKTPIFVYKTNEEGEKYRVCTNPEVMSGPNGALFNQAAGWCCRGVHQILKHSGLFPKKGDSAGCNGYQFGKIVLEKTDGWALVKTSTPLEDAIPGDVLVIDRLPGHKNGHVQIKGSDNYWYSDFKQNFDVCLKYRPKGKTEKERIPRELINSNSALYRYSRISNDGKTYQEKIDKDSIVPEGTAENANTYNTNTESTNNSTGFSSLFENNSFLGKVSEKVDSARSYVFNALMDSGIFTVTRDHQIRNGEEITGELTSYSLYRNTPPSELKYLRAGLSKTEWAKEVMNQTGKSPSELIVGTKFNSAENLNATFSKRRQANGFYEFSPITKSLFEDPSVSTANALREGSDKTTAIYIAGQDALISTLQETNANLTEIKEIVAVNTSGSTSGGTMPAPDLSSNESAVPASALQ